MKFTFKGPYSSCVVLCSDRHFKNVFINHLKKHLARAGLEISIIDEDKDFNANCLRAEDQSYLVFIKTRPQEVCSLFSKTSFVEIHEQEDYYLISVEALRRVFPGVEHLFKTFLEEYDLLKESAVKLYEAKHLPRGLIKKKNAQRGRDKRKFQVKNWLAILGAGSIIILLLGLQIIKETIKIQAPPPQEDAKGGSIRSDMIIPTESGFLHRPQELEKLDNIFKKEREIQSLAIIGPGGVGKTVLARQYARQQHAPVIWEINAETAETLNASFENLACALAASEENKKRLGEIHDIKNPKKRESHLTQFVKDRLKACSHWFLLYDNVEKFTDIQKYFPQDSSTWGRGKIILTTRDKNIQNHTHINNSLHIQNLIHEEKLHLFLKIMADEEDSLFSASQKESARKFLENIPPYPLDVSIAAYYLKSTHLSYEKYLENLLQNPKEFTETQKNILKEAGDYSKTRYEIITLTLQKLIDLDSSLGELLFLVSLLDSQNIPRDLLDTYKNPVVVDNFMYHLKKYSLGTSESSHITLGKTISFHRSTQTIILDYLTTMLAKDKVDSLVSSVVDALEIYVKDTIDTENFLKITPLISHLKMVLGHNNMLSDNVRCSLYNQLGRLCYHLRDYGESRGFLEKSLAIGNNNLSHDEEFLITTLKYLALTNMELGDHKKAKEIVERCLNGYKLYFLQERVDVAETLSVMADVYGVIGEYKKAQRLFEKSLEIYKKTAGDDLAPTAFATVLLGNVYVLLGEYHKGHTFLEQGLKIYQEASQDYFATAATFVLFGNSYLSLGEPEKAKSLIQQGVDVYRSHLSEKHIDLGWALVYLASAFEALGENNRAKMILQESLEIHSDSLGQENIRSASVLFHLGRVNLKLGLLQEARELLQTAHKAYEKEYGPAHIETARIYRSFGEVAQLEGNLEEAEKHLWKALNIFQANNHTDCHILLEDLADLHKEKSKQTKEKEKIADCQDNQRQAVKLLEQADKIIKARFSEDSPHIKRVQEKMSNLEY